MDSRRFEERGRGWADTAHATDLQLADTKGGWDEDLRQKYKDRKMGGACSADRIFLSSYCCRDSGSTLSSVLL